MTNYSKTTNFTAKDSLVSGDANKIVKGSEIDAEFDNIATASATKANIASPAFTGVVSFPDGTAGDPSITNTGDTNTGLFFSAADTLAFSSAGTAQFTMSDGAIAPVTDNDVDLGTSSLEFKDGYFDGTVHTDAINLNGTAITSTAAEINILDGVTATAAELNILDGVTSTAAELNILDGVTSTAAELNILDGVTATTAELNYNDTGSAVGTVVASKVVTADANKDVASFRNITLTGELDAGSLDISGDADIDGTLETDALSINGTAVTSTAAELNILDGVTSTAAELNILDGVTSTAAELNILDGVTATTAELNIMDGVTATTAELNIMDGVTASAADINLIDGITNGTVIASKAIITDSNKDITGGRNITISGELDAATLDISGDADIDGTLETDALSINGTAVTSTAAELNILDGVTSTAAELNILDGVTSTAAELNILDGVTSTAAELNILDGVTAVAGELNALDLGSTAVGIAIASKAVVLDSNKDFTGVRNFSITGDLSVAGTTTVVDSVQMTANNAVIFEGATADASETTLTSVDATADRTISLPDQSGTLPVLAAVSTTAITSTPEELNVLDGITAVVGELNALDLGSTAVGTAIASKAVILDSNKDYTGIRNFTITGELDAGSLDISGDIDVDGTTNLDVVDIDGAVDMASTLQVDGAITSSAGATITVADNSNTLSLVSTDTDANVGPILSLYRSSSSSAADSDFLGRIALQGLNDANQAVTYGKIFAQIADASDGTEDGILAFRTVLAGTDTRRIDLGATETVINEDSADLDFRVESNGNANMLFVDGGNDRVLVKTSSTINNATLNVAGSIAFDGQSVGTYVDASGWIDFTSTSDTNLMRLHSGGDSGESSQIEISTLISGTQSDAISVESGGTTVINQDSNAARDFRVESDSNTNALFVDAGNNRLTIDAEVYHDSDTGNQKFFITRTGATNQSGSMYVDDNTFAFDSTQDEASGANFLFRGTNASASNVSYLELDYAGGTCFNQGGLAQQDFRVESDSNDHAFFINGEYKSLIGMATSSPVSYASGDTVLYLHGSANPAIALSDNGQTRDYFITAQGSALNIQYADGSNTGSASNVTTLASFDNSGHVTMPNQPAFSVTVNAAQNNIAVSSDVTINFGSEIFDVGSNFASNVFTAPVTGKYQLNLLLRVDNIDTAANYYIISFFSSNRNYRFIYDPGNFNGDPIYWATSFSVLADMDASDTVYVTFNQGDGTAQSDIDNNATYHNFSGYLVA